MMAKAKKEEISGPAEPGLGAPSSTARLFTEKELRDKAAKWAAEIERGQNGNRQMGDTIPPDLEAAKALAGALFLPADGAIFAAELEKAVQ